MQFLFIFLISIFGLIAGSLSAQFLPTYSADILSPIGLTEKSASKPLIIGFQPYWLLDSDKDYINLINQYSYYDLPIASDGTISKLNSATEENPGWTHLRAGDLDAKFAQFKKNNIQTSLLLYADDAESVFELIKNPKEHADNLISDAAPIMRKYGFTDLNLDIETFAGASEESRLKFTQFVKYVKEGIDREKLGTLSFDVITSSLYKKYLYEPYELGKICDYIIFMMYDFHYPGSLVSGAVAPMAGGGTVRDFDVESSLKDALKIIPAHKIILGIPTYGYEWETLSNVPASPTIPGSGVTASGKRVEELLKDCKNCTTGRESLTKSPYVIYPDDLGYYHQIYYEDKTSLQAKVDLAKQYELGGVALWALGYESSDLLDPLVDYKQGK